MSNRYRWHKVIQNRQTGVTKTIRGMTKADVEQKAALQQSIWIQQIAQRQAKYQAQLTRQAQQDQLRALEEQATIDNQEAQEKIAALQNLLRHGLNSGKHFQWDKLKKHTLYPSLEFSEKPPTYEWVAMSVGVPPERGLLEGVFGGVKAKRERLEEKAREEFATLTARYNTRKNTIYADYAKKRGDYEKARDEYNASVDVRRSKFEQGDPETIIWFVEGALNELALPEDFGKDFDIAFEPSSGIVIINMQLPALEEVPRISGYKFVKSRKAIDAVELKQKDFDVLYESFIYQISLLAIHRVFREAKTSAINSVIFNGWVTGIDRKTGNDFTSCILSVQTSRQEFQSLVLDRVDPKECIRSLKGLVAGPLAQLAPVRPILDLNKEDSRFIESRDVLANLSEIDNLATMDWQDFEHLVRDLFEKYFGEDGAEVRITQASRDRGVDAIAFDPDPIRGGKFVIQAKRYNNVVPASAVRELYGTMVSEGAVKGILVTTSHYGNDSREFAKDRPLTLLDGANLIHMFQKYGYQVRIDLKKQ